MQPSFCATVILSNTGTPLTGGSCKMSPTNSTFTPPHHWSRPNISSRRRWMYARFKFETMHTSSMINSRSWESDVRITFCASLPYPAGLPSCCMGSCRMVIPPTLNAASPVGAVTAHNVVSFRSSQMLDTSAQMVLIRNDFPVPPTLLTNRCSGFKSWHVHVLHYYFIIYYSVKHWCPIDGWELQDVSHKQYIHSTKPLIPSEYRVKAEVNVHLRDHHGHFVYDQLGEWCLHHLPYLAGLPSWVAAVCAWWFHPCWMLQVPSEQSPHTT